MFLNVPRTLSLSLSLSLLDDRYILDVSLLESGIEVVACVKNILYIYIYINIGNRYLSHTLMS